MRSLALAILVFPLACSSFDVDTIYDPRVRFSTFHSYDWVPARLIKGDDPRLDYETLDQEIRAAVDRELAERGQALKTAGEPDYWVRYYVVLQRKVQLTSEVVGSDHGQWTVLGLDHDSLDEYEAGTLIIDVLARNGRSVLWRAYAHGALDSLGSPREQRKRIQAAVEQMLERFPPE